MTAWLALEVLGADYRFETRFYLDDKRVLYVKGGGDPYLISEELAPLATELVAKIGKAPITGLVVDASYYPSNLRIPGIENDDTAYDALNSALGVNFNTIYAERIGNKVRLRGGADSDHPDRDRSVPREGPPGRRRPHQSWPGPCGRPPIRRRADRRVHPARRRQRERRNLDWNRAQGPGADLSFTDSRARLSEILVGLLLDSNNYTANQVFLEIGGHELGGPVSLEKSLEVANTDARRARPC